jgi:3-mercaptopyruvate sulfurtransferase SseA
VVLELRRRGYERAFLLKGGWLAWEEAGYPAEPKPPDPEQGG